ncbi:1649_t:CDS:2 [Rhizophagus irregularis]|nr:1649_t:CDS:2 [Rhizophagus irregularis]
MCLYGIRVITNAFYITSSAVSLEVAASPLFEGTGPLLVVAVAVAVSSMVFVLVPISGS